MSRLARRPAVDRFHTQVIDINRLMLTLKKYFIEDGCNRLSSITEFFTSQRADSLGPGAEANVGKSVFPWDHSRRSWSVVSAVGVGRRHRLRDVSRATRRVRCRPTLENFVASIGCVPGIWHESERSDPGGHFGISVYGDRNCLRDAAGMAAGAFAECGQAAGIPDLGGNGDLRRQRDCGT